MFYLIVLLLALFGFPFAAGVLMLLVRAAWPHGEPSIVERVFADANAMSRLCDDISSEAACAPASWDAVSSLHQDDAWARATSGTSVTTAMRDDCS